MGWAIVAGLAVWAAMVALPLVLIVVFIRGWLMGKW